jgi:hypothetical protein
MIRSGAGWLLSALLCTACDGEQYVNPGTVELVITDTSSGMQRVNRCNYVPVLQGSHVVFRYQVEDGLKATLFATRDEVSVGFEPADGTTPFRISSEDLAANLEPETGSAPDGYELTLRPGCKPDGEYR